MRLAPVGQETSRSACTRACGSSNYQCCLACLRWHCFSSQAHSTLAITISPPLYDRLSPLCYAHPEAAICYLFFQAILLVDFAYSCHEWLGQDNSLTWWVLLRFSLISRKLMRHTVTIAVNVTSVLLFFLTMYWWGFPVRLCYQNFIVISSGMSIYCIELISSCCRLWLC